MIDTNTKGIARKTGRTTREINQIARDLNIPMHYRADLKHWVIDDRKTAAALLVHIQELDA